MAGGRSRLTSTMPSPPRNQRHSRASNGGRLGAVTLSLLPRAGASLSSDLRNAMPNPVFRSGQSGSAPSGGYSSILSSLKITGLFPSVQHESIVPFCSIHGKSPPRRRCVISRWMSAYAQGQKPAGTAESSTTNSCPSSNLVQVWLDLESSGGSSPKISFLLSLFTTVTRIFVVVLAMTASPEPLFPPTRPCAQARGHRESSFGDCICGIPELSTRCETQPASGGRPLPADPS